MVLALGQVVNSTGISLKIGVLRSYSQTHSSSLFGLHLVPICLYITCFMRSQWKGNWLFCKDWKRVNLRSCSVYGSFQHHTSMKYEVYYPNTLNNSPCGGFQIQKYGLYCPNISNLLQRDLFRIFLALKQKIVNLRRCCFNRIWFANLIHWISI